MEILIILGKILFCIFVASIFAGVVLTILGIDTSDPNDLGGF